MASRYTLTDDELQAAMWHLHTALKRLRAVEKATTDTEQGEHLPYIELSLIALSAIVCTVQERGDRSSGAQAQVNG